MKTSLPLSLIVGILLPYVIFSQQPNGQCGLHPAEADQIIERLIRNRNAGYDVAAARTTTTYLPVKIHLVADNEGEGRMSEQRALDMLCLLNHEFESWDIQFYLHGGFSYPDNSVIHTHSEPFAAVWQLANGYKAEDAINIFVASTINEIGVYDAVSYYINGGNFVLDMIFVEKNYALFENILPHAMGHFLGLPHTFHGWKIPWDEQLHGNPVDSLNPWGYVNETMSGSNCMEAADLICDTPPDYIFALSIDDQLNDCDFTEEVFDPEGTLIEPMENNMMSYFSYCLDYVFTTGQATVMHADLLSPERDYVNPGITPTLEEVGLVSALISPINGVEVPYNTVTFQWLPASGASHYLFELDIFPNFAGNPFSQIVETNEIQVTGYFEPFTTYFWRVRPFNEYRTCTFFTTQEAEFSTNDQVTGTGQLASVDHWCLYPNPVNDLLYLKVETARDLEVEMALYTVTGKKIRQETHYFPKGTTSLEWPVEELPDGLYWISIKSGSDKITKRILIR